MGDTMREDVSSITDPIFKDDMDAFNDAFAAFKVAATNLEAAKKEFLSASLIYEAHLRNKLQRESLRANSLMEGKTIFDPNADNTSIVLRPILNGTVKHEDDVATKYRS